MHKDVRSIANFLVTVQLKLSGNSSGAGDFVAQHGETLTRDSISVALLHDASLGLFQLCIAMNLLTCHF